MVDAGNLAGRRMRVSRIMFPSSRFVDCLLPERRCCGPLLVLPEVAVLRPYRSYRVGERAAIS